MFQEPTSGSGKPASATSGSASKPTIPKSSLLSAQLAGAGVVSSPQKDVAPPTAEVPTGESLDRVVAAGRYAIKQFLSQRTAYDLMPPSGKVVVLDKELRIKNAFEAMAEHGLSEFLLHQTLF